MFDFIDERQGNCKKEAKSGDVCIASMKNFFAKMGTKSNIAQKLIESTNVQLSTKDPLLPKPC